MQVGQLDDIEVNDTELAHTGQGQIHGRGGTQTAGADDQRAGFHHLALAGAAHILHDDVSAVAFDLIRRQAKGLHHVGSSRRLVFVITKIHRDGLWTLPLIQRKTRVPDPSGGKFRGRGLDVKLVGLPPMCRDRRRCSVAVVMAAFRRQCIARLQILSSKIYVGTRPEPPARCEGERP